MNQHSVINLVKRNSVKSIDEFLVVNLNKEGGKAKDTTKVSHEIPTVFKFKLDLLMD